MLPTPDCGSEGDQQEETMSKKAAEHHRQASEHHTHAARHHSEAAKHHEAENHEKAAHHAHTAQGHMSHAREHANMPAAPTARNTATNRCERLSAQGDQRGHVSAGRSRAPNRRSVAREMIRLTMSPSPLRGEPETCGAVDVWPCSIGTATSGVHVGRI